MESQEGTVTTQYKTICSPDNIKSVRCSLLRTLIIGFCDSDIRATTNSINYRQRQLDYGLNIPYTRTVTVQVIPLIP